MTMAPRLLFDRYYRDAVAIRAAVRESPSLRPWFSDREIDIKNAPPILCFGFPRDPAERIPLVTLGINPSADEIRNECVSPVDDPDVQFGQQASYFDRKPLEWFARAQKIMRTLSEGLPAEQRATYGGVFRGRRTTIHLDVSPIVTVSINKPKTDARKTKQPFREPDELQYLLKFGAQGILLPLLTAFIEIHGVNAIVVLGTEASTRLRTAGVGEPSLPPQVRSRLQWAAVGSGPSDRFLTDEKLIEKTRQEERTSRIVREALLRTAVG